MARKARRSKSKKRSIPKRSKTGIKKRQSTRVKRRKKRSYKRKKRKKRALKISVILNVILIAFFGYLIYQSDIGQNFKKRKERFLNSFKSFKETFLTTDRVEPIKESQSKKAVSSKKETTPKYSAPKKIKTTTKAARSKLESAKPSTKKTSTKKSDQKLASLPKSSSITLPAKPIKKIRKALAPKAKLVFVIDDIGNTVHYRQLLEKLGNSVTYAILPKLPYSAYFSQLSLKTKAEVIMHLPLEANNGKNSGPGLIKTNMSLAQIRQLLDSDLKTVPHHVGINNHMGSQGTSDAKFMDILLREIKAKGIFFLDSRTSTKGVPSEIGKRIDLPVLERDVFLDNIDDKSYIRKQLQETAAVAQKKGYAIAIGHYRPNTLQVLSEEIPRLKKEGFAIVSLSDIVSSP